MVELIMKTSLYTNCALVRVPIKAGVEEYYLPQNVAWANEKIDKLVMVCPQETCIDPIDGQTHCVSRSTIADCYITLYDTQNREIMHDVSFEQILHLNNNVLPVNAQLNLSLCKIYFTTAPAADETLLLYAFYGTREEEYYDIPRRSTTVHFPLGANEEISFRSIIDHTIHAIPERVKGIIVWDAADEPLWLQLRDHDLTYQMVNIHSELCRPDNNFWQAYDEQAALFLLNDLDIDFDYSTVRDARNYSNDHRITFLY